MILWTAFLMGLVANFHCIAMCGPISMAVPIYHKSKFGRLKSILIYNIGRITTYAILGVIFGFIGKNIAIVGVQQQISIILGFAIIIIALFPKFISKTQLNNSAYNYILNKLKKQFTIQFKKKSSLSLFIIGFFNGLLPCAMVYTAIAGALTSSSIIEGSLFMIVFGFGTLPTMIALPYLKNSVSGKIKSLFQKIITPSLIIFGIILILRGSNLDIPYLSPKVKVGSTINTENCH